MVVKKDKDLDYSLSNNHAFVCFRPFEDVFLMLSYARPESSVFHKNATYSYFEDTGYVFFSRYKNGVSEQFEIVGGRWIRLGSAPDFSFTFSSQQKPNESSASVSDTEAEFDNTFTNLNGGTTNYSFKIRRSTLRFAERYQWAPSKDTKDKEKSQPGTDETVGYCGEFN
jgi:hypothetical protein